MNEQVVNVRINRSSTAEEVYRMVAQKIGLLPENWEFFSLFEAGCLQNFNKIFHLSPTVFLFTVRYSLSGSCFLCRPGSKTKPFAIFNATCMCPLLCCFGPLGNRLDFKSLSALLCCSIVFFCLAHCRTPGSLFWIRILVQDPSY
jgi:hypothetical protein